MFKKNIRKKFQIIMNMSIIRNRLVALTQRIENLQTFTIDLRNKF